MNVTLKMIHDRMIELSSLDENPMKAIEVFGEIQDIPDGDFAFLYELFCRTMDYIDKVEKSKMLTSLTTTSDEREDVIDLSNFAKNSITLIEFFEQTKNMVDNDPRLLHAIFYHIIEYVVEITGAGVD